MRLLALLSWLLPLTMAAICPMEHHNVCNDGHDRHRCVCALVVEEASAPDISCNKVVNVDDDDGRFPAVSVRFSLSDADDDLDEFPEDAFAQQIANNLRTSKDSIIITRVGCLGTDDEITVQFAVLKKEVNTSSIPYNVEHFLDAEKLANRMKSISHLRKIADLEVDSIDFVEQLIDIEHDPDNSVLVMQAIIAAAVFGGLFLLGICFLCRRRRDEQGYSGDLQKA